MAIARITHVALPGHVLHAKDGGSLFAFA
jgi:hypothetical protein